MGVIRDEISGEHDHLLPDGDESCFHCGDALLGLPVVVFEGFSGLVHGVRQHARRAEAIYLHPWCADVWAEEIIASADRALA